MSIIRDEKLLIMKFSLEANLNIVIPCCTLKLQLLWHDGRYVNLVYISTNERKNKGSAMYGVRQHPKSIRQDMNILLLEVKAR